MKSSWWSFQLSILLLILVVSLKVSHSMVEILWWYLHPQFFTLFGNVVSLFPWFGPFCTLQIILLLHWKPLCVLYWTGFLWPLMQKCLVCLKTCIFCTRLSYIQFSLCHTIIASMSITVNMQIVLWSRMNLNAFIFFDDGGGLIQRLRSDCHQYYLLWCCLEWV